MQKAPYKFVPYMGIISVKERFKKEFSLVILRAKQSLKPLMSHGSVLSFSSPFNFLCFFFCLFLDSS
jgi:hypothetical protein